MDAINRMADAVHKRMVALGYASPNVQIIRSLLRIVHTASLITEEGRFVQASVTLADPKQPDAPPYLQRADYPQFTALQAPEKLTPEFLVKIARAVDRWSGSIAIWGTGPNKLVAWGIVDQLVGTNTHLNRENIGGFSIPGILTIKIDRPGDLTAYHESIFLCSLRAQRLLLNEAEVFDSEAIIGRLIPAFKQRASAISSAINKAILVSYDDQLVLNNLLSSWKATVARICIGLRRMGTGGTLIITPSPNQELLSISHGFQYERLGTALTLQVLDDVYEFCLMEKLFESKAKSVSRQKVSEIGSAEEDARDRADEVTGAVKLVTSLAAMDGAILMGMDLSVIGFGVKIGGGETPKEIYDGEDFEIRGKFLKRVDTSRFGTRHASALRYCKEDADAIGVIISQDGHVRVVLNVDGKIVLWDRVQLLNHENFSEEVAIEAKQHKQRMGKRKISAKLGYSRMPKSLSNLLAVKLNKA